MQTPLLVDPQDALMRATRTLLEGHFDDRSLEGAQANALEAIAWALIGLLGERLDVAPVHAVPAVRGRESLTEELRARGFVAVR